MTPRDPLGSHPSNAFALTPGFPSLWLNSQASFWPATLQPLCLGREPKARVATVPLTWVAHGQTLDDASEEVPMVTQLDEERWCLWELAKANLEKAHKRYKDFADKSR